MMAGEAKRRKCDKCKELQADHYCFEAIAVECLGAYGPSTKKFVSELGKRLVIKTGEPKSASFFKQSLSMIVQRGNANCMINALPQEATLRFYNY